MILEDGKKCTRKRKNKVVKIAHRNDRPVNHISTPEKKDNKKIIKNRVVKCQYELYLVGATSLDFVRVNYVPLACHVQKSFGNSFRVKLYFWLPYEMKPI